MKKDRKFIDKNELVRNCLENKPGVNWLWLMTGNVNREEKCRKKYNEQQLYRLHCTRTRECDLYWETQQREMIYIYTDSNMMINQKK